MCICLRPPFEFCMKFTFQKSRKIWLRGKFSCNKKPNKKNCMTVNKNCPICLKLETHNSKSWLRLWSRIWWASIEEFCIQYLPVQYELLHNQAAILNIVNPQLSPTRCIKSQLKFFLLIISKTFLKLYEIVTSASPGLNKIHIASVSS